MFQVFPRASIEAKEAAANAPSSSDPKKTTEPAEKPALHRYFRIQHVGWERFGTSRWVSELDCRKIYASPDGVATEEERELQRIEFAKDHVRAKTDRELKFDWTDAYADVIIKITEPGVKEEEIEVRVTGERMLDVCFRDRVFKMGTLQSLSLFLAGAVSPKQCSLKLEADRVIVTLRKAKPMLWDKLEGKNPVSGGSQQHRVTRVFAGRKPEGASWFSVDCRTKIRINGIIFV